MLLKIFCFANLMFPLSVYVFIMTIYTYKCITRKYERFLKNHTVFTLFTILLNIILEFKKIFDVSKKNNES